MGNPQNPEQIITEEKILEGLHLSPDERCSLEEMTRTQSASACCVGMMLVANVSLDQNVDGS